MPDLHQGYKHGSRALGAPAENTTGTTRRTSSTTRTTTSTAAIIYWGCPYCYYLFRDADELRGHLDGHTVQVLADVQRKFRHTSSGTLQTRGGREEHPQGDGGGHGHGHGPDDVAVISQNSSGTCPWPGCDDSTRYRWSDGDLENLQRHFNGHIRCNIVCAFCGANQKTLQEWKQHWEDVCSKANGHANDHAQTLELEQKNQLGQLKAASEYASSRLAHQLEQRDNGVPVKDARRRRGRDDQQQRSSRSVKRRRA